MKKQVQNMRKYDNSALLVLRNMGYNSNMGQNGSPKYMSI